MFLCRSLLIWLVLLAVRASAHDIHFGQISTDSQLAHRTVNCVYQDHVGFLWFGTQNGLNRYNGYKMELFSNDARDPASISGNKISAIFEDSDGDLWIGTDGQGLNRFDRQSEVFLRYSHNASDPYSLGNDRVHAIVEGPPGTIWLATDGAGLARLDKRTNRFTHYTNDPNDPSSLSNNEIRAMIIDSLGRIYLGTNGGGLDRFDPATGQIHHYGPSSESGIRDNIIRALYEDRNGHIWIGLFSDGLDRLDPSTGRVDHFPYDPANEEGVSDGLVRAIWEDSQGELWVGTNNGLDHLNRKTGRFKHYRHNSDEPSSLSHNSVRALVEDRMGIMWVATDGGGMAMFSPWSSQFTAFRQADFGPGLNNSDVWAIYEDNNGLLWIGTNGGGLNCINPITGQYSWYRHRLEDPSSLSSDGIWAIVPGDEVLWLGTSNGLNRFDPKTGKTRRYTTTANGINGPSDNMVWSVTMDSQGILWLGTRNGGINRFDPRTEIFTSYQHDTDDPTSLSNNTVLPILEDPDGNLILGTWGAGLDHFDPDREIFVNFRHYPGVRNGLSHNEVNCLYMDTQQVLWVGTRSGLNRRLPGSESFDNFFQKDGLPTDVIQAISADDHGNLWLSTTGGLCRYSADNNRFRVFDVADGLIGETYNQLSVFRSQNGQLYFGGREGFNAFDPSKIRERNRTPPVVLTRFSVLNKEVDLNKPPYLIDSLELAHDDLMFSFEFATLSFADPRLNRYSYKMQGLNDEWVDMGTQREMTFNKMKPGQYTLLVRGANNDGIWSEPLKGISIKIRPPWYRTLWAYVFYAVMAIGGALLFLQAQRNKLAKERMLAHKEMMVAHRLRQIGKMKDEFLANTSHELRTPLNGIIGIAESLMEGVAGDLSPNARRNLGMIVTSGRRLGSLVDDILDFSLLKARNLELDLRAVDLHALIDVVFSLTKPTLKSRNIQLINQVPTELGPALADENRLLQVLHNLVGNAVKFTEKGSITLEVEEQDQFLLLKVIDTGIGIRPENLERIFESFEQADGSATRQSGGTGLGLTISRQLVELHGGRIWAESEPGHGSTFLFTLKKSADPVVQQEPGINRLIAEPLLPEEILAGDLSQDLPPQTNMPGPRFKILIVDDEVVNRQVLLNYLSLENYELREAPGGTEALLACEKERFDLILLDIMMPKVSGYEVCQRLRNRYPVHELPIIFLSARNQVSGLVTGFDSGANDFLTKPITRNELISRVRTHLQLLDINRHLEEMVSDRTRELEERNRRILMAQSQLIMKDKMASLGTLTAGVAHEIKNPLNFINNLSFLSMELTLELRQTLTPFQLQLKSCWDDLTHQLDDLEDNARIIHDHGSRVDHIIGSMMELARNDSGRPHPVDMNDLIDEFTTLAYQSMHSKGLAHDIQLEKELDPVLGLVDLDQQEFSRCLVHLVNNALEALEARRSKAPDNWQPRILIQTEDRGNLVQFSIKDNGQGIDPSHMDKIFTPFFTTRPANSGNTGLGLSFVYDVVARHNGTIRVHNTAETEFIILLPKHYQEIDPSTLH